eukprot:TRINITY_DN2630_c0_g1_i1.p1 TRINITY_DN2630_c0_g1~~TRINITY_DN2630_c0_g1_i1.p1  ORF type:complete len:308 (+),score=55.62 TRINITY_DN2630_c0_g1_i1:40-924(+)
MDTQLASIAPLASLLPPNWKKQIIEWLQEDIPSFDFGGFVVGTKQETAVLLGKAPGVLAGVPFVTAIFEELNCTIEWKITEGSYFEPIKTIAVVRGQARNILLGERTALNLIARASGIATRAHTLKKIATEKGWKGTVAGTRKTTPGFRLFEKYAMLVGGCDTHRYDLSSMVMLKDNHVMSTGSITAAVKKARSVCGFSLKIEVECQNQKEAEEAIDAGADVVMLDNFEPDNLKVVARNLKQKYTHSLIEASGGVTVENIADYFTDDVDVISLGLVTQSVPHIDYSLKIRKIDS